MTTKTPNQPAVSAGRTGPRPVVILDTVVAIVCSLVGLVSMLALTCFNSDQFVAPRVTA